MQEPSRFNLLSLLQKALKVADKKIYLQRVIYIASTGPDLYSSYQDNRVFSISIESNIKLINEEYCEDIITGFGLFYTGYFIVIIEGPEETIIKHLRTLLDTFDQNLKKIPPIEKMKLLLVCNHVNKRYYNMWNGRHAVPPVLLDRIEPSTSPEVNSRHVQNCIMKLYKMSEYLKNQPVHMLRATMDNITELCRPYLPEVNLLDFLLDSPALMDLKEYVNIYGSVPEYSSYHENVWPVSSSFVPYNILGDEGLKDLMSTEPAPSKIMPEKAYEEEFETEQ